MGTNSDYYRELHEKVAKMMGLETTNDPEKGESLLSAMYKKALEFERRSQRCRK